MQPEYSFIIPVYNRPDEIRELLESMRKLISKVSFEVVIIEDGSDIRCDEIVRKFSEDLNISYYFKSNSGPGDSRNFGMKKAKASYFLILDSDVILPEYYLMEVHKSLSAHYCDCFGGPDTAHSSFSDVQKAINYSMTSFFTTGGIRGKKNSVNDFQPRSFNMGISKKAFEASQGFGQIHPGEDPDLSLRLKKAGFKICLIPEAEVFHKRRINWGTFYTQVRKFGLVRPILNKWHPDSSRIAYWFPSLFIIGLIFSIFMALAGQIFFIGGYLIYFLIIAVDAAIKTNSIYIGMLAIRAVLVQFTGYGFGFLNSTLKTVVLNRQPEKEFPHLFFKKNAGA